MRRDTRIQIIAAAVLVVCMAASGLLTVAIAAESGRAQLGYADRAEESDPPEVALGIALGAFRGLFVNILWIRAQDLKQEGKFHEAIELSRTITRLQPRFPRVWGFHAWNMAYNISVATSSAEERWQWVKAGINLLRDEGIPKNPNDVMLHKELAWLFIHKIQGYADDANHYYKRQLAREWTIVLGSPPPRAETFEATKTEYVEWLQTFSSAAPTLEALYQRHPRAEEFVRRMREEAQLEPDFNFLRQVEMIQAVYRAWTPSGMVLELAESERNEPLERLVADYAGDEEAVAAIEALILHTRRRILTEEYHMELPRMIRYTRRFGPFDWRHPAS
ncbi:MAG: hypothetical protein VYC34_06095, partial [Planctomycetota bacterium]|nr:hypothetical protein [Planctomycetota bacterium]